MTVCITILGPPTRLLVIVCGVDMGPLGIAMPKNGFTFSPAMGLMVQCANLVQIDMGLNLNHRLSGLIMVWEIAENGFDDAS